MTTNTALKPISLTQKQAVVAETRRRIDEASAIFDICLPFLPVRFDLKGKCAGMYKSVGGLQLIRYNPWIFAKYFRKAEKL